MQGIKRFIKKVGSLRFAILVIVMLQTTAISADTQNQTFTLDQADLPIQADLPKQANSPNEAVPVPKDKLDGVDPNPSLSITTGKPVHTVQEARSLLLYIVSAEGLKTTKVTFQKVDDFGNYYFDVWYSNFPHNTREVTYDGYVVEDHD